MSIIKSIMHKFNGTEYDTLHPETEHAQVTDFGQGVVTHLLASTLASTVTAVTSGSLFGKMVQLLLDATGCKYLMAQNGYICFGSLFGGLILQWGIAIVADSSGIGTAVTLPISFNKFYRAVMSDSGSGCFVFAASSANTSYITIWARDKGNGTFSIDATGIFIAAGF